jgi:hypothetical protein
VKTPPQDIGNGIETRPHQNQALRVALRTRSESNALLLPLEGREDSGRPVPGLAFKDPPTDAADEAPLFIARLSGRMYGRKSDR